MEYHKKKDKTNPLLGKALRFTMGFLASIMTIIIILKIVSSYLSIVFGIALSFGASYYLFKKSAPSYRPVAFGIMSAGIFVLIAAIAIWIFVYAAFQGIAG